jgi:HK97 gp10 family phage protein
MTTKFEIVGLKETLQIFQDLENEIGDKKGKSKILIPAVKLAMKPVLSMAKSLVPFDNSADHQGVHLRDTLSIVGRKPTKKDTKSKYIKNTDTVIAIVTSKKLPAKLKKAGKSMSKEQRKIFYKSMNQLADGRAAFNEFGTAKMTGKPFMRPAMESQASNVATQLGEILKQKIEQYRSKTA